MPASKSALLVIDLQVGMFDGVREPPLDDHERLLTRTKALIAWARERGHAVTFIRHDGTEGDGLAPGAPGWPVEPRLGQKGDEPTFAKSVGNAFSRPELAAWLRERGVEDLILAGAQTDQCVKATLDGALGCGFRVTLAADAHGTWPWDGETAPQIIARHNVLFAEAGASVLTTAEIVAA
jgi:nicotinamidase-related amidase